MIREVRRIKEDIAAQYGYDVRAIAKAAREHSQKHGRKALSRPPKRVASQYCPVLCPRAASLALPGKRPTAVAADDLVDAGHHADGLGYC